MARFFLNEEFQSVDMNARFSRRPMEVADIKLLASTAFGGARSPRKGAAPVSWDPLQIIAERIDQGPEIGMEFHAGRHALSRNMMTHLTHS
jgi:hypothetical protein